jgi:hypothetical protein
MLFFYLSDGRAMVGQVKPIALRRRTPRGKAEEGQVLLEFLINFFIFFFLIWALVQVAMIASTKLLTNYASWAAARAWSVNVDSGDGMSEAKEAAKDVLSGMHWQDLSSDAVKEGSGTYSRTGIVVDYKTTLGIPTFLTQHSGSATTTRGYAPMTQEPIKKDDEDGDNK